MLYTNQLSTRFIRAAALSRSATCASQYHLKSIRTASTLPSLPILRQIARHDPNSTAVIHSASGRRFTYGELLVDVAKAKDKLHWSAGKEAIDGERIAFIIENSYDYVGALNMLLRQTPWVLMSSSDIALYPGLARHSPAAFSCLSTPGVAIHIEPESSFHAVGIYQVLQKGSRCL